MSHPRILVAEDDDNIRRGLQDTLESEGYEVTVAADGQAAIDAFREDHPDLVLLDIMMPRVSGFDVCREVRKDNASIPIIMLTAKGEEIDKVLGLGLGADDYVTKPFGVRELLARIDAVLRRSKPAPPGPGDAEAPPDRFTFGSVEIDRKRYEASREGAAVSITSRELELIDLFCRHPGEVLSRDTLLDRLWGVRYHGTTRTLDQHIAQLRKKIEKEPSAPRTIVTVHGIGYRYDSPDLPR